MYDKFNLIQMKFHSSYNIFQIMINVFLKHCKMFAMSNWTTSGNHLFPDLIIKCAERKCSKCSLCQIVRCVFCFLKK